MTELANPASITDVTSRSFRTLTAAEQTAAVVLLGDAWSMLLNSDVGTNIKTIYANSEAPTDPIIPIDPSWEKVIIKILANAVLRVVRNPNGMLEEEGDDYRGRRDSYVSSGRLYLSADEIAELFPPEGSGNAFTIKPGRVRRENDTVFMGALDPNAQPPDDGVYWDPVTY